MGIEEITIELMKAEGTFWGSRTDAFYEQRETILVK